MTSTRLIKQFRVDHPDHFRLASVDPTGAGGLDLDKEAANGMLTRDIEQLAKLQERLYAQHQWALLVVLQGIDTAGKDGVIKHVDLAKRAPLLVDGRIWGGASRFPAPASGRAMPSG